MIKVENKEQLKKYLKGLGFASKGEFKMPVGKAIDYAAHDIFWNAGSRYPFNIHYKRHAHRHEIWRGTFIINGDESRPVSARVLKY